MSVEALIAEKLGGNGTDRCIARLAATGIIERFGEFMTAEYERGTSPGDLLHAVSAVTIGIEARTLQVLMKPGSPQTVTDVFLDARDKAFRAAMSGAR